MTVVIIGGLVREVIGDLPHYNPVTAPGAFPMGHSTALLSFGAIYILLKSFANGGSSLTGLEAISNGVSTFKTPRGLNARKTLVVMSCILAFLVAGVSWLAHATHAVAYVTGSPTVISQVAKAVLGDSAAGHVGFLLVQLATMLILYTGANTPFNGFPFLANFVAADGFLPRWMTKRGHRLAFSNGIVVLTVASLALLLGTGAHVDRLVAFYAIGVFTGFTLAGFGMAKHFRTFRGPRWKSKVAINNLVGAVSGLVVLIFAVTKFTEGAWLVVLIFPIMVIVLLRLHRAYDREAALLEAVPSAQPVVRAARSCVVVLVDAVDLAVIRAIRYAHTLRPSELHVVHFVIDSSHAADLRRAWDAQPGLDLSLETVDCPDRRLPRAALELTERLIAEGPSTQVTMLLPRRSYGAFLGRMLHDRTADDIAVVRRHQAVQRVGDRQVPLVGANAALGAQLHARLDTGDRSSAIEQQGHPTGVVDQLAAQGRTARDGRDLNRTNPSLDNCCLTVRGVLDGHPVPPVQDIDRRRDGRVTSHIFLAGRRTFLSCSHPWAPAGPLASQQRRGFGGVVGDDGGHRAGHGRDGRGDVICGPVVQHAAEEGAVGASGQQHGHLGGGTFSDQPLREFERGPWQSAVGTVHRLQRQVKTGLSVPRPAQVGGVARVDDEVHNMQLARPQGVGVSDGADDREVDRIHQYDNTAAGRADHRLGTGHSLEQRGFPVVGPVQS